MTQTIPAIRQLNRYPANEKWIAIPYDTFSDQNDFQTLLRYCKKNGIGLLQMNENENLVRYARPLPIHETNNYLKKYKKSSAFADAIGNLKVYGNSPSENWKILNQMTTFAKLSLVPILVLVLVGKQGVNNNIPRSNDIVIGSVEVNDQNHSLDVVFLDEFADENTEEEEIDNTLGSNYLQPCSYFMGFNGKFIVVDQVCMSPEVADERIGKLIEIGYEEASYVRSECFDTWVSKDKLIIHTNHIYNSEVDAIEAAHFLKERLLKNGIEKKYCHPLRIDL